MGSGASKTTARPQTAKTVHLLLTTLPPNFSVEDVTNLFLYNHNVHVKPLDATPLPACGGADSAPPTSSAPLVFVADDTPKLREALLKHTADTATPHLEFWVALRFEQQSSPRAKSKSSNAVRVVAFSAPSDAAVAKQVASFAKVKHAAYLFTMQPASVAGGVCFVARYGEASKVTGQPIALPDLNITGCLELMPCDAPTLVAAVAPLIAPAPSPGPLVIDEESAASSTTGGGASPTRPRVDDSWSDQSVPFKRVYVVHDVENCRMPEFAELRDADGNLTGGFSDTPSNIDAGVVYKEVVRAALTPAIGKEAAEQLDVVRDVKCVTYCLVMNRSYDAAAKRHRYMPSRQCLRGCHAAGMDEHAYDKDADVKVKQLLNRAITYFSDDARRTLLVLISGDRDFCPEVKRARESGFDIALIHSTDAEVNPAMKSLLKSPEWAMPVWNHIEAKARIELLTPTPAPGAASSLAAASTPPRAATPPPMAAELPTALPTQQPPQTPQTALARVPDTDRVYAAVDCEQLGNPRVMRDFCEHEVGVDLRWLNKLEQSRNFRARRVCIHECILAEWYDDNAKKRRAAVRKLLGFTTDGVFGFFATPEEAHACLENL